MGAAGGLKLVHVREQHAPGLKRSQTSPLAVHKQAVSVATAPTVCSFASALLRTISNALARTCVGGVKVETTVLGARPKQLHPEDSLFAAMADRAGMLMRFSSGFPGCARITIRSSVCSTLYSRSRRPSGAGADASPPAGPAHCP
jgi:hypothetical protein